MNIIHETNRLWLREFEPSDADDLFAMDSLPEVHIYLGNRPMQDRATAEIVINNILDQYKQFGIGRWVCVEKSSGNFIGWSGLKYITTEENNRNFFYDVGYRLHPAYWGKGYATESAKAAIAHGFNTLQLEMIVGAFHIENKASRRALEKCGLLYVEDFIWDNRVPCHWLEITKDRYQELIQYK